MSKKNIKILIIIACIIGFLAAILTYYKASNAPDPNAPHQYASGAIKTFSNVEKISTFVTFNEFYDMAKNNEIDSVYGDFGYSGQNDFIFFTKRDAEEIEIYITQNPNYEEFKRELLANGIDVNTKGDIYVVASKLGIEPEIDVTANLASSLITIVFILYISAMFYIMFINGRDVAKRNDSTNTKKFNDIGGLTQLKEDLKTVVDFLKEPEKYHNAGSVLPKGILLIGPPGTGKTLIANVMANEASVNFLYCNASDFTEKYVGVGATRVRNLFKSARRQAPCIIFIDEIDSLCGSRTTGLHSEDRKTLTALLTEMDGFKKTDNIMVVGATNRIEDLDSAVLRPGRFTDIYTVPIPETDSERMEVIEIYMEGKKFAEDFNKQIFCDEMVGRSPAEIQEILNEASIISVKKGLNAINRDCIEEAFLKRLIKGHQKDNNESDPEDMKVTAYHEAGHVLIAKLNGHQVSKATITPSTSGMGGATITQPIKRKLYTKEMLKGKIMELYAGRAAEYIAFGKNWENVTNGASNDFKEATELLKSMVEQFGMGNHMAVNFQVLYGPGPHSNYEKSIIELSDTIMDETIQVIEDNFDKLEKIALLLLEKETIYEDSIDPIFE